MASIVGHSLGALAVWETGRRIPGCWVPQEPYWYIAPCVIALVPDLDVFFLSLDHRGASHSLLAVLTLSIFSTVVIALLNHSVDIAKVFFVTFFCALVHLLLDYLMGCGPKVMFFWPLSTQGWLSPIQLVPTAYYARSISGLLSVVLYAETWKGIVLEFLSLGGLWMAIRSQMITVKKVFIAISLTGFVVIWILYN